MNELLLSQFTSSALVVFAIEWLKKSPWFGWIKPSTAALNRFIAWTLAAGTAIGIHFTYDSAGHTLTVTGLGVTAIAHGLWHWANSIAAQELIYTGVQIKNTLTAGQKT